jgi:hypothetical protein
MAHAGGLGLGLALGMATVEKQQQLAWIAVAVVASLLTLSTLLYCPWHPLWVFR